MGIGAWRLNPSYVPVAPGGTGRNRQRSAAVVLYLICWSDPQGEGCLSTLHQSLCSTALNRQRSGESPDPGGMAAVNQCPAFLDEKTVTKVTGLLDRIRFRNPTVVGILQA